MKFPTTHWTMIRSAAAGDTAAGRLALEQLLQRYMPVLRQHLVRHKRIAPVDADDLLNGFVMEKILEKHLLQHATPDKGRFRSYLLTALDNHVASRFRHDRAAKRASPHGPALDLDAAGDVAGDDDPARAFELAFAQHVLAQARQDMQAECEAEQRPETWAIFEARLLKPAFEDAAPVSYGELMKRFNLASEAQASNRFLTARRMFERHLRRLIGEYASGPREFESELSDLMRIVERPG